MILLCNTFLTDAYLAGKGRVVRQNLKSFSNVDIFKYSLASLAIAYKWSSIILNIELDTMYQDKQKELQDFIAETFKEVPIIVKWKTIKYQREWQDLYNSGMLNDGLIWFYCNHDHIFFDSSPDYLTKCIADLRNDPEKNKSLGFSHFPEGMRTTKEFGHRRFLPNNQEYIDKNSPSTYKLEENYMSIQSINVDSIRVISRELYYDTWFGGEFNHVQLPRPDFFGYNIALFKTLPLQKQCVPIKEICRHFDGYHHVTPPITNNQCPALDIPIGFFEKEMKIRYGYDDYKEGWTNINPLAPDYHAFNLSGTDYRFTLDDMPLVWKDKIAEIDTAPNLMEEDIIHGRFESLSNMIYTSNNFDIDENAVTKCIDEYSRELKRCGYA